MTSSLPLKRYTCSQYKPTTSSHEGQEVPVPDRERDRGVVGFRNLGNTCFLNAGLQCLLSTPSLVQYFLSVNSSNVLGSRKDLIPGVFEMATKFMAVVKASWNGNQRVLDLTDFIKCLREVHEQFKDYQQHDAHEFLGLFLGSLHGQINQAQCMYFNRENRNANGMVLRSMSNPSVNAGSRNKSSRIQCSDFGVRKYWEQYLKKEDTVIRRTMSGLVKNSLICSVCHSESITFDPFMDLILPIPLPSSTATKSGLLRFNIYQCLDLFVATQHLDGENSWFCLECETNQNATKHLSVSLFPDYLIICLKRFVFNSDGRSKKLLSQVEFPLTDLDLKSYLTPASKRIGDGTDSKFDLFGCICHKGRTNSGHYTAYTKNPLTHEWNFYDDRYCCKLSPGEAEYSSAYVLFYKRQNVDYTIPEKIPVLRTLSSNNSSLTSTCPTRKGSRKGRSKQDVGSSGIDSGSNNSNSAHAYSGLSSSTSLNSNSGAVIKSESNLKVKPDGFEIVRRKLNSVHGNCETKVDTVVASNNPYHKLKLGPPRPAKLQEPPKKCHKKKGKPFVDTSDSDSSVDFDFD